MTLAHGNPVVSLVEDVLTLIATLIALVAPFLVLLALALWLARRAQGTKAPAAGDR
jgi:hypothetical protein